MIPHPHPPFRTASPHGPLGDSFLPLAADWALARRLGLPVLVVENDALIAMDLARQIEDDGGAVIGPAESAVAALALLGATAEIGGAVLDVFLDRGTAFPVARALARRRIPFVFYTAYDDVRLPPEFVAAPMLDKTAGWSEIRRALFPESRSLRAEAAALLPALRRTAREIAGDDETGDRLVERTLERAAAEVASRGHYPSVDAWLRHLLKHLAFGRDPSVN